MSLLVKLIYYESHQMMKNLKEIELCHFSILLEQWEVFCIYLTILICVIAGLHDAADDAEG